MLFNGNGDTLCTMPTWHSAQTAGWMYGGGANIKPTLDGGYIYCGLHQITAQTSSMIVVKLDSNGYAQYTSILNPSNNYANMLFYPNPATNTISISTSTFHNEGDLQFLLMDVNSKVLVRQPYQAGEEINIAGISSGIYFGEVSSKTKTMRGKVIVQH